MGGLYMAKLLEFKSNKKSFEIKNKEDLTSEIVLYGAIVTTLLQGKVVVKSDVS